MKLSEIFIPLSDKTTYSLRELSALNLQSDFIKRMAAEFDLIYADDAVDESNLCFAESKEVRPEYRTTFRKVDVIEYIFTRFSTPTVNMEQSVAIFRAVFF